MEQGPIEAMKRQFAGPMTDNEISFLRDIQAFIEFCIRNGLSFTQALSTISNDVSNFMRGEHFPSKVTGYAEIMQILEKVRNDPDFQEELNQLD